MSEQLKPCPFCGEPAALNESGDVIHGRETDWSECPAGMTICLPDEWNHRPIEDALQAEIKATALHELMELRAYFPLSAGDESLQTYIIDRILEVKDE